MWYVLGIVALLVVLIAWSACAAAGRADEQPRCPVTGQPLSSRSRYDSECE